MKSLSVYEKQIIENKDKTEIPTEQRALIYVCVCNVANHNKEIKKDITDFINIMPYILRKIMVEKKKLIHNKENTKEIYGFSKKLDAIYEKIYSRNSHLASVVQNFTIYNISNDSFIESLKNKEVMDTIIKYEKEDKKFYGNVSETDFDTILNQARRLSKIILDNNGYDTENKRFVYNNEMFDDFGFIKDENEPEKINDPAFITYPYMDFGGFDNEKYNSKNYETKIYDDIALTTEELKKLLDMKIWINPNMGPQNMLTWDNCPIYTNKGFGETMTAINEYWDIIFNPNAEE